MMTSIVNNAGETVFSFTADGGPPDFTVRSGQDKNTVFLVQRAALAAGSQVFKDMFNTCDPLDSTTWVDVTDLASSNARSNSTTTEGLREREIEVPTEFMEMGESADILQMLFRVLHEAPVPLPSAKEMSKWEKLPAYYREYKENLRKEQASQASPVSPSPETGAQEGNLPVSSAEEQGQNETNGDGDSAFQPPISSGTAVPLPLLRKLFILGDKWDLNPTIMSTLQTHLVAHAFDQPLEVYGLAYSLGFEDVAAFASTKLYWPALETYHPDTLARTLPNIQSLQKLYILHAERKRLLRNILVDEPLYPHGYGKCTSRGHADALEEVWRKQKRFVLSMDRVHPGTDVAAEMSSIGQGFANCGTCQGRINAVVKLLQYKSSKIPRSISKLDLPADGANTAATTQ